MRAFGRTVSSSGTSALPSQQQRKLACSRAVGPAGGRPGGRQRSKAGIFRLERQGVASLTGA